MTAPQWDVALGANGKDAVQINVPGAVARALKEKGLNRATLTLTDDGILLRPYQAPQRKRGSRMDTVELPDWGSP